jgi:nicotinate-nucleotide adenylyltransferase
MNLGLLGGTFDPVHRGHLAIARAAMERFNLRLVYFVPAAVPPHKGDRQLTDFHHRYAMLALATREEQRFVPSLVEAHSAHPNYSIHTVRRLKSTLKQSDKLYFVIGIDAFLEISSWKEPEPLLSECDFIVASRPGHSLADVGEALPEALRPAPPVLRALRKHASGTIALLSTTIHLLPGVKERVSSTQIRAAAGKSVRELSRYVPEAVASYIQKEHLYISNSSQGKKGNTRNSKVLTFRRAHLRSLKEQNG